MPQTLILGIILSGRPLAMVHVSPGKISNKICRKAISLQIYLLHRIIAVNILMILIKQNGKKLIPMQVCTDAI